MPSGQWTSTLPGLIAASRARPSKRPVAERRRMRSPAATPSRAASGAERPTDLRPHRAVETYDLVGVLALSEAEYETDWVGTAMRRATLSGLRRNAAVVLGNLGDTSATGALEHALDDPDPVVRGHAAWALGRLGSGRAALDARLRHESDDRVRGELHKALA